MSDARLTPNDLHQLRLAADHGWPVDRYPLARYFATLDAVYVRAEKAESRVAVLEEAAVAVVEHWDGYNDGEWGEEDKKGARLLKNLRAALSQPAALSPGEGAP